MIIIREATGTVSSNKRRDIAIKLIAEARKYLNRITAPSAEDYLLLYCDMMLEMGANLDLLASSPANDFLKKTAREISSYALKKVKDLSLR
jgi:hypothetical protein